MVCRQHLSQLLDGLALLTQQAASASGPHSAASLLHLTQALADQHASLCSQTVPPDFADLLAEAVRKSVTLCVSCVRHQVQAITLRLATSDMFDVQAGSASGTQSPCSFPPYIRPLAFTCLWSCHIRSKGCQAGILVWLLHHFVLGTCLFLKDNLSSFLDKKRNKIVPFYWSSIQWFLISGCINKTHSWTNGFLFLKQKALIFSYIKL